MKYLVQAHVITTLIGELFFLIMAAVIIKTSSSYYGQESFILAGLASSITLVDLLTVLFAKKRAGFILIGISKFVWGMVFIVFSLSLLSPNQPWQSKMFYAALAILAVFKLMVIFSFNSW